MNGLKNNLHAKLVANKYISYSEVVKLCEDEHYKAETATRRMRELQDAEPVFAEKERGGKYIVGWKYVPIVFHSPRAPIQSRLIAPRFKVNP